VTAPGIVIRVHLQPKASREEVVGLHGDAVKIRVLAPPSGGKANEALRQFIAARCGIPVGGVEILAGQTSRHKVLRLVGISKEEVERCLGLVLPAP